MRYAVARFNIYQRDAAYRIYVTEALRIACKNTGTEIQKSLYDLINEKPADTRKPEEVVSGVLDDLKGKGLEVI